MQNIYETLSVSYCLDADLELRRRKQKELCAGTEIEHVYQPVEQAIRDRTERVVHGDTRDTDRRLILIVHRDQ